MDHFIYSTITVLWLFSVETPTLLGLSSLVSEVVVIKKFASLQVSWYQLGCSSSTVDILPIAMPLLCFQLAQDLPSWHRLHFLQENTFTYPSLLNNYYMSKKQSMVLALPQRIYSPVGDIGDTNEGKRSSVLSFKGQMKNTDIKCYKTYHCRLC